jgi:hypothetical protein
MSVSVSGVDFVTVREFELRTHPLALHVEDVEATRSELEVAGVNFLAAG